jgi:hypothetical protein
MNKLLSLFLIGFGLISCNDTKAPADEASGKTGTLKTEAKMPEFAYPVRYKNWEIGKPEHIKTALDFYRAWDDRDPAKANALFADTLRLRIPDDRNEIVLPRERINTALAQNRAMYDSTSNDILSAVSLHDKESGEDWVMVTTYNKWKEKGGKRDSLLYQDNWKLKDGKLALLMSFSKMPTRQLLSQVDSAGKK